MKGKSSKKLYLIRRKLESFVGPYSIEELRKAHKAMEFGIHDEIAGHAGEWIALHDLELIREYYPELSEFVSHDLLGGWGQSTMTEEREIVPTKATHQRNEKQSSSLSKNKKHSRLRTKSPSKTHRNRYTKSLLLLAATSIVLVMILSLNTPEGESWFDILHVKINPDQFEIPIDQADKLYKNKDDINLQKLIESNSNELLLRVQKSKKIYSEWIPYLRWYYFIKDGNVSNLPFRFLRGTLPISAPTDCSSLAWKNKANLDASIDMMQAKKTHLNELARIPLWDPTWIRRRKDNLGWKNPSSYYEACILQGLKTLRAETNQNNVNAEASRLLEVRYSMLSEHIQSSSNSAVVALDLGVFMRSLYCLDRSPQFIQLENCSTTSEIKTLPQEFQSYLDERKRLSLLRLISEANSENDEALKLASSKAWPAAVLDASDSLTKFDFNAELRVMRLVLGGIKTQEAWAMVQSEYPGVNFKTN